MMMLTTMMTSLLEQCIRKNNEGVSLLLEGKDNEAGNAFKLSLAKTKQILALSPPDQELLILSLQNTARVAAQVDKLEGQLFLFEHSIVKLEDGSCFPGTVGGGFIFQGAIRLMPLKWKIPTNRVQLQTLLNRYSACTIYNLALLFQRLGGKTGNQGYLQKSMQMYKWMIKLLEEDCRASPEEEESHSIISVAALLLLIAKNNLSQTQLHLGLCVEARQHILHMSRILHSIGQFALLLVLSEKDFDGLVCNTMEILKLPHQSAPAA